MSITPNDPANFTPTLQGYTGQGAFRFWCQTVLPLVYDDSLSYYELLNKVVYYLNNVISDVSTVESNVAEIADAYNELQQYVNDYFTSLDVQQEINTKLDQMASSGALSLLLAQLIPDLVTDWMNEHITPTTPIVDDSLTISGAAADAKVTGDELTFLEDSYTSFRDTTFPVKTSTDFTWTINKSINANGSVTSDTRKAITNSFSATGGTLIVDNCDDYGIDDQQTLMIVAEYNSSDTCTRTTLHAGEFVQLQNDTVRVILVYGYLGNSGVTITEQDIALRFRVSIINAVAIQADMDVVSEIANEAFTVDYHNATNIPQGTDFNDLITPGNYYVSTNTRMSTMLHSPVTVAARVFVLNKNGNTGLMQIVIPTATNNDFFVRNGYNSGTTDAPSVTWQLWANFNGLSIFGKDAITSSNYTDYFSDYDDAPFNSVYTINGAPLAHAPKGTVVVDHTGESSGYPYGTLITFGGGTLASGRVKVQIFISYHIASSQSFINFRTCYNSSGVLVWTEWQKLSEQMALTSSNIAIRAEMITGGDAPFDDLDDAPINSIYQLDLDLTNDLMGHNPVAGHSGVLITTGFSFTSRHGLVQMCFAIDSGVVLFIRYGYQQTSSTYSWTPWRQVTTDIPPAPSSNGTYTLQCVVSGGIPTYSWVSAT